MNTSFTMERFDWFDRYENFNNSGITFIGLNYDWKFRHTIVTSTVVSDMFDGTLNDIRHIVTPR